MLPKMARSCLSSPRLTVRRPAIWHQMTLVQPGGRFGYVAFAELNFQGDALGPEPRFFGAFARHTQALETLFDRLFRPEQFKAPTPLGPAYQFQVFIDDVRLPADALVGDEDGGLVQLFAGLNPERIMAASFSTGLARYALDKATSYVKEREVWGKPIGSHQGLAHPLAQTKIEIELARLMTQKAAALYEQGDDMGAGEAANMAKLAGRLGPTTPGRMNTSPKKRKLCTVAMTRCAFIRSIDLSRGRAYVPKHSRHAT